MKAPRTMAGRDTSQQDNGPNLFVLPYDWRRDISQSAAELAEFVNVALSFNPDAETVDIIAHSMGGMVSRRFIIDQTKNRVNKFISVDTPYLGAPKFINVMQTGDFAAIPWTENRLMKRMARFFTGGHQLAPSLHYFEAASFARLSAPVFPPCWGGQGGGKSYGGAFGYEP